MSMNQLYWVPVSTGTMVYGRGPVDESSQQHDNKQINNSPVEHQQAPTIPAHCEMKHGRSNSSPWLNETGQGMTSAGVPTELKD